METDMLTNETIIENNCDDSNTSRSIETTLAMDIIQNMGPIDDNSNSCSVIAAESFADLDEPSYETKCRRQIRNQRSESFPCDSSSMMSCCSDEEEMKTEGGDGDESDSELREDEIFYDSTNENEDLEHDKPQEDCGLRKLYLNDIEIDCKEEEQTVTEMVEAVEKDTVVNG